MRFNALDAVFPFIKENARNNFVVRAGVQEKPGNEAWLFLFSAGTGGGLQWTVLQAFENQLLIK